MTAELLKKLKSLQHERGNVSPFASPLEFEKWADEVAPLLSFNEKLQYSFKHYVKIAKFNSRTNSPNIDQINETIGILNQAASALALGVNLSPQKITEPQKQTFWHHPITKTILYVAGVVGAAAIIYFLGLK